MPKTILSKEQLKERVPYSASHIARLEKGGEFPKRIKLGACRVGWLEDEIEAWIESRVNARNAG